MVYLLQFRLGEYSMKKLENFWFYYKKHILIGLSVLLAAGYLLFQTAGAPEPDYHIGLVQASPCTETELHSREARFAAAGEDLNGDGQVLVQIHTYFVDLSDDSPNAGVNNAQTVSALDADLIGGISGMFLLEDVDTFQTVTNHILEEPVLSFEQELFLALRKDADNAYKILAENLS